jgi:hypothetical protein
MNLKTMLATIRDRSCVILAPHVDDEVIGCFSLLAAKKVSHVVYFFDLDPKRIKEAHASASYFGFNPVVLGATSWGAMNSTNFETILVPNIKDLHPHHKAVNQIGRSGLLPGQKILFYSVDMNTELSVLDQPKAERKLEALNTLFPSQKRLWLRDDKYWLFESIQQSDLEKTITIKTSFEGIHAYPDAPKEVAYLKYPHRHVFHVTIEISVFHNDREIEFVMFKHEVENMIRSLGDDLNYQSCEMLAEKFLDMVILLRPRRSCKVSVFEDNENGSTVVYNYL